MRSIFILALWTITASSLLQAQNINIPDANFKAFLVTYYDTNNDGEISEPEAEAVTGEMDCRFYGIADLTGIAFFINLTGLYCKTNRLTSLPDLSALINLTSLDCSFNELASLPDLSALINLTRLECDDNQLTSLPDLSALINLTRLECDDNQLTSLPDLSALTNLELLYCEDNQLTSLPDLSALTNLEDLRCFYNQLMSLPDLSTLISLEILACSDNQLTSLPDLSALINLKELYCSDSQLTSLPDITDLPNLRVLSLRYNHFDGGDCLDIQAIQALNLPSFSYNPQQDSSWLDCDNVDARPAVSVSVTSGFASEWGVEGTFNVTLAATLPEPLTVTYTLSGTAENGIDYEMLPGQVTIPANNLTAEITVRPLADLETETDERVQINLLEATQYQLGSPREAYLTIGDEAPTPETPEYINADNYWLDTNGIIYCYYPDPNLDGADLSGSGDLVYVVTFEIGCQVIYGPVVVILGAGESWPLVLDLDTANLPTGFVIRTSRARAGDIEGTLSEPVVVAGPETAVTTQIPEEPTTRELTRWLLHVPKLSGGFSATLKLSNSHPSETVPVQLLGFSADGTYLGLETVTLTAGQTDYREIYGSATGSLYPNFEDTVATIGIVEGTGLTSVAMRYTSIATGFGAWTREVDFRQGEAVATRFEMEGRIAESYQDGVAILNLAGESASEVWLVLRESASEAVLGETYLGQVAPGAKLLSQTSSLFPYAAGAKYLIETRDTSATIQVLGLSFSGGDFFSAAPVQKRANPTNVKRKGEN